jgi:hypothetical protein
MDTHAGIVGVADVIVVLPFAPLITYSQRNGRDSRATAQTSFPLPTRYYTHTQRPAENDFAHTSK